MTYAGGVAVSGIDLASSSGEPAEIGLQALQLSDALPYFGAARHQQLVDMRARHLAAVAHGHDFPDLAQCEPDGLGCADEREAVEHAALVVPVAGRRAGRRVDDADVLVEAQGLVAQARSGCDFTDAH